jgi:hypothetical protein
MERSILVTASKKTQEAIAKTKNQAQKKLKNKALVINTNQILLSSHELDLQKPIHN